VSQIKKQLFHGKLYTRKHRMANPVPRRVSHHKREKGTGYKLQKICMSCFTCTPSLIWFKNKNLQGPLNVKNLPH